MITETRTATGADGQQPGVFITFEGGEGAGKSTQLHAVGTRLARLGHDVLTTREPGGSPGAEALRDFLLFGGHDLAPRAEVMAHFAARCDHVDRVIRPALAAGRVVLCDRFFDSTMAYQGYGQGHGDPALLDMIDSLRRMVGLEPERTFLFEVSPETGRRRIVARLAANAGSGVAVADRYERADAGFHERIAAGFQHIADAEPGRFVRISSEAEDIEAVTERVVADIDSFLRRRG